MMFYYKEIVNAKKKKHQRFILFASKTKEHSNKFLILSIATTTLHKKKRKRRQKVQPFKVPSLKYQEEWLYKYIVVLHEMWLWHCIGTGLKLFILWHLSTVNSNFCRSQTTTTAKQNQKFYWKSFFISSWFKIFLWHFVVD